MTQSVLTLLLLTLLLSRTTLIPGKMMGMIAAIQFLYSLSIVFSSFSNNNNTIPSPCQSYNGWTQPNSSQTLYQALVSLTSYYI